MLKRQVMIVEDDAELIRILNAVIKPLDVELHVAGTGRKALQLLQDTVPSILLLDLRLPDMDGIEILRQVREKGMSITVIVMTAHGSVDRAVEAMRHGAYDFLTKPLDFERVRVMVRNALERHDLIEQLDDYRSSYERARFHALRGSSPAMERLYKTLSNHAAGNSPILVLGDPGTERLETAESIHRESPREKKPLVSLNLATLPPTLIRAAIAGGPGTLGTIEQANGGTLFIDNVHLLPPDVQSLLSDFLQTGTLPSEAPGPDREFDTRIVAASDRTLKTMVDDRTFDEDLYCALNVVSVRLPRLADRGEDILDLAEAFIASTARELDKTFASLSSDAEGALLGYEWPENVSELRAAIREAITSHEGPILKAEMLPERLRKAAEQTNSQLESYVRGLEVKNVVKPLWQVEQEVIERALKIVDNNVIHAARLLEITPAMIYRKQRLWRSHKA